MMSARLPTSVNVAATKLLVLPAPADYRGGILSRRPECVGSHAAPLTSAGTDVGRSSEASLLFARQ
jgi:hypothetical protein